MPTAVWWDLESCNVESGRYGSILIRVKEALGSIGEHEEIVFHAYSEEATLTRSEIDSLKQIDNVMLTLVPGDKDALVKRMISDMGLWAVRNRNQLSVPYFLISGNGEFGYLLGCLGKLKKHRIFIAHPTPPSDKLVEVATKRWSWPDLKPLLKNTRLNHTRGSKLPCEEKGNYSERKRKGLKTRLG